MLYKEISPEGQNHDQAIEEQIITEKKQLQEQLEHEKQSHRETKSV